MCKQLKGSPVLPLGERLPAVCAASAPPGTPMPALQPPAADPPPLQNSETQALCTTSFVISCDATHQIFMQLATFTLHNMFISAPIRSLVPPAIHSLDHKLVTKPAGWDAAYPTVQLPQTAASTPCGPLHCAACAACPPRGSPSCRPDASADDPAAQCPLSAQTDNFLCTKSQ